MNWWQALIVALSTLIVTKALDLLFSKFSEKREFTKYRRKEISDEIEALKNEIGILVELAANWKSYEQKQRSYLTSFENDHELIGKVNKYPSIAQAARDTVQWCKIVADCERELDSLNEANKTKLREKFNEFITACDHYMNDLV